MNITDIFGMNVFSKSVMKERLPKKIYQEMVDVMENGGNISMKTADIVANAMKDWAVEKGATHYTHWFQPLKCIFPHGHHGGKARLFPHRPGGQPDHFAAHRQAAYHG